jgi:hypothetical protein
VELRKRLGQATHIFDTEFTEEKLHAQSVLSMMRAYQKKQADDQVTLE